MIVKKLACSWIAVTDSQSKASPGKSNSDEVGLSFKSLRQVSPSGLFKFLLQETRAIIDEYAVNTSHWPPFTHLLLSFRLLFVCLRKGDELYWFVQNPWTGHERSCRSSWHGYYDSLEDGSWGSLATLDSLILKKNNTLQIPVSTSGEKYYFFDDLSLYSCC